MKITTLTEDQLARLVTLAIVTNPFLEVEFELVLIMSEHGDVLLSGAVEAESPHQICKELVCWGLALPLDSNMEAGQTGQALSKNLHPALLACLTWEVSKRLRIKLRDLVVLQVGCRALKLKF